MGYLRFLTLPAVALMLSAPVLRADEISDWNDKYRQCSNAEAQLLDDLRRARESLDPARLIFIGSPEDYIMVAPDELEAALTDLLDYVAILSIDEAFLKTQPLLKQVLLRGLLASGGAVPAAMAKIRANDKLIRAAHRSETLERIRVLDQALQTTRNCALEAIEQRDAAIARRDSGQAAGNGLGAVNYEVCFDRERVTDRLASLHQGVYGGTSRIPVKGSYICLSGNAFHYDTGGTLVEYSCSFPASGPDCRVVATRGYETGTTDEGVLFYDVENYGRFYFYPAS